MEQINFGVSTKNIPIPDLAEYRVQMIHSVNKFVRNIRWKSHIALNPQDRGETKETFQLKSTKAAPRVPQLEDFEEKLFDLTKNIKHKDPREIKSEFQKKLDVDVKVIKQEQKVIVGADKTTNFYKMKKEDYDELLMKDINKDYKKAPAKVEEKINKDAKKIATKLEVADRVFKVEKKEAVVTIKDHKPNYRNNTKTRLINPTKSYLGKVSKIKLASIIQKVRLRTGLSQWKNTSSVIHWFKGLSNKHQLKFIQFDINSYYPRITEDLLTRALDWAETITTISGDDRELFRHTKESLLFDGRDTWVKKGNTNFDVGMGSYDGAETCDIVGLFLLSKLQHLPIQVGLYRDDGLAVSGARAQQVEKLKQNIHTIFEENGLEIAAEANLKVVDFLDVTLDLEADSFKPYMKPNDLPLYVHRDSNHPTTVTKCIPSGVNKRLSSLSSTRELFDAAKAPYQEALERSGYGHMLEYEQVDVPAAGRRRSRRRNIPWFNPPFCRTVATNVGRKFLGLLDSCFPPGHPLHQTLNRNTVKLSYRTMPSLSRIIAGHNRQVLRETEAAAEAPPCNCRVQPCIMEGRRCRESCVVYQAIVSGEDGSEESYLGISETEWKLRYNNHTASFRHASKKTASMLSKYIWKLKDKQINYRIAWKILATAKAFSSSSRCCRLCLKEKYFLMHKPELGTLNKRDEFYNHCRHQINKLV